MTARDAEGLTEAAIWQRVEFGNYAADLDLWIELAEEIGGPILELGAGAGRVTLELAARGHRLIAVERDGELASELERAAECDGLPVSVVRHDLDSPEELLLPEEPRLAIGPLHLIQIVEHGTRSALLRRLGTVLAPGATIALTVVDESTLLSAGTGAPQILPDMRELDGWVYSSEPRVQVGDDVLSVRRIRERVSPQGSMERSVHDDVLNRVSAERLEAEARGVGLDVAGRRQIVYGPNEADSAVVLLEVPR
jgi:predicted O-methyltransferase YrrM